MKTLKTKQKVQITDVCSNKQLPADQITNKFSLDNFFQHLTKETHQSEVKNIPFLSKKTLKKCLKHKK